MRRNQVTARKEREGNSNKDDKFYPGLDIRGEEGGWQEVVNILEALTFVGPQLPVMKLKYKSRFLSAPGFQHIYHIILQTTQG
jgi:hypothetical protein